MSLRLHASVFFVLVAASHLLLLLTPADAIRVKFADNAIGTKDGLRMPVVDNPVHAEAGSSLDPRVLTELKERVEMGNNDVEDATSRPCNAKTEQRAAAKQEQMKQVADALSAVSIDDPEFWRLMQLHQDFDKEVQQLTRDCTH